MRPQARPIEFQSFANKEVVNYSAIANKAKQLSDNIRTVAFDQVNDSITFKSSLIHDKPPVSIKPSDNSINNVSSINCTDGSTITGITSDSSNTDPTKAISAAIMIDVNNRIESLETKTQNQTATANETTFTGNITADTFNGYHLGFNNRFYNLPAIPFINNDLVMEVGRYIDFHYNAASGVDKTSRLYISKPGTLYYDHSFVINGGDIKARNCISDKGNLNNIVDRTVALETKNTEQDTRLDNIETKNTEQDTRLAAAETKNTEQDTRLAALETKTQNQSATQNETTFTGNVNADTFNGVIIAEQERYTKTPFAAIVRTDGCMEVGRYIDFHNVPKNGTLEDKDYSCRLDWYKGVLQCTNIFTAMNLKRDNEERLTAATNKNTEQDTRLTNIESKNNDQDTRLDAIEEMDIAQNETIRNINTKNNEQDTRLDTLEIVNREQDTRIDTLDRKDTDQEIRLNTLENTIIPAIETKNTEQDTRLNGFDESLVVVDNRLNTLESNQITLTMKNIEHITHDISGTASFANNIFTFVFNEQPTTGKIYFAGVFFDGNDSHPADFMIYFSNGAYSKMEILYLGEIWTNTFRGEYNSSTLTFKLIGKSGSKTLNTFYESTLSINMPKEEVITHTQDTKSLNILSEDLTDNNVYSASKLLDAIYPVGSIYLSLTKSPPSLGGTWELLEEGRFLRSVKASESGKTGGSSTHTHTTGDHKLTAREMPVHRHAFEGHAIRGTVYDIMKYDTSGQTNKPPEGAFSVNRYGSRTWQGTDGSNRGFSLTFEATPTGSISSEGNDQPHNHGNTGSASNLPPYITCFMYKRTA